MKKKLAALLCGVMCMGAFSGCSSTELAYLQMSRELVDTMSTCTVEGKIDAKVDLDALEAFAEKVTGEESYYDLSGKKNLTVDYDMTMNFNTLAYEMSFDVACDGKQYDLGTLYYGLNDGIYVTSDTLLGVYQLAGSVSDMYDGTYVMSDAFAKDLQKVLAQDKYIELMSAEEMTGGAAMPDMNYGDLYDAAFTFYEDVLDGFETGMITASNGGYKIQANGRQTAELLTKLVDFIAAHPEQVLDATEVYMQAVMDTMPVSQDNAAAKEELTAMFAEARNSKEEFVGVVQEIGSMLKEVLAEDSVQAVLDGFRYEADVKKTGNGFASTEQYTLKNGKQQVATLKNVSTVTKATADVAFPKSGISAADLKDKLIALEGKYNPVTGVAFSWGWEDENCEATVYTMREDAAIFDTGAEWADLVVENGRTYLPLRLTAELLQEEVGWDKTTRTAYIMQDGKRVDMQGKLVDGTAFVAVRDFEKLGYTVTYSAYEDILKEVLIEK